MSEIHGNYFLYDAMQVRDIGVAEEFPRLQLVDPTSSCGGGGFSVEKLRDLSAVVQVDSGATTRGVSGGGQISAAASSLPPSAQLMPSLQRGL